ncbi:hypothetical protein KAU08_12280, partial [bacterium]|nr:hypothetical protein [bacterium]
CWRHPGIVGGTRGLLAAPGGSRPPSPDTAEGVKTGNPGCRPETPKTPRQPAHKADRACLRDTVKSRKKRGDTDTPDTG